MAVVPEVVEPAVAPAPPADTAVETQHTAEAARALENIPEEVQVGEALLLVERFESGVILFLPKSQEGFGSEADLTGVLEPLQLLFASDPGLAFLEAGLEADLGEIHLGQGLSTLVRLLLENLPACADEGDGVEEIDCSQNSGDHLNDGVALHRRKQTGQKVSVAETLHIFGRVAVPFQRMVELGGLATCHYCTHDVSPFLQTCFATCLPCQRTTRLVVIARKHP